jgi:hypothetical protein
MLMLALRQLSALAAGARVFQRPLLIGLSPRMPHGRQASDVPMAIVQQFNTVRRTAKTPWKPFPRMNAVSPQSVTAVKLDISHHGGG